MIPTRKQLDSCRNVGYRQVGYFAAFCGMNDACESCDPVVRFWCKVKKTIEKIQTRRILRICNRKRT